MSDPLFSRPALDGLDDEPELGTSDRRRKALAVGALAVAGLAGAGLLLLGGGSDEVLEAPITPVRPVADGIPAPEVTAQPPQVVEDARPARDPFQVLYVPPAPPASGTGTTGSTGSTGTTGTTGTTAGAEGPTTTTVPARGDLVAVPVGAPAAGTGAVAVPATRRLLLEAVRGSGDSRTAVFVVGEEKVSVGVGDAFGAGGDLLLLSLQQGPADGQWTAVVQVRTGEPFDVVTGSPVTVS